VHVEQERLLRMGLHAEHVHELLEERQAREDLVKRAGEGVVDGRVVHGGEREVDDGRRDRRRLGEFVRELLLDLPERLEAVVCVGHCVGLVHKDLQVQVGRVGLRGQDEVDETGEVVFWRRLE
jgi:hypothetical protein